MVFLRHRSGSPLGPITPEALEVLYDARVVDGKTPISVDGQTFALLEDDPALLVHLEAVKDRLGRGEEPWPEPFAVRAPPAKEQSGPAGGPRGPLAAALGLAARRARGHATLRRPAGEIRLQYREGKIVGLSIDDPDLCFEAWLSSRGLVPEPQLAAARVRSGAFGGDIGAALVAEGALRPDSYFEQRVRWATVTLGRCLLEADAEFEFEPAEVEAPAVPLGFDRYRVLLEAVREAADRTLLEQRTAAWGQAPLIPSQVEGVGIEDLDPRPRELRALNAVNGVLTAAELKKRFGGTEERDREVLRALLFAVGSGFVVLGQDPRMERDRAEAARLERELGELEQKNLFEIFGISERSSDEDVRQRYTDFAKRLHPDGLAPGAAEELRDARERLFAFIGEAFQQIEESDQRYQYALDLDSGRVGGAADRAKVEAALEAETLFKKAEILLRVKKYKEALDHLDEARRLAGSDPEFEVLRAYLVYLDTARRGGAEAAAAAAIRAIFEAMKTDGNIIRGYLYLGYLHKTVQKPDVAVKYFKKVLEYDESHAEALREVRLAQSRKDREKKRRWGL